MFTLKGPSLGAAGGPLVGIKNTPVFSQSPTLRLVTMKVESLGLGFALTSSPLLTSRDRDGVGGGGISLIGLLIVRQK